MNKIIYMDNHATTPVDPRVLEEMLPYFTDKFGNAASHNHSFGWDAAVGVEDARAKIAKLINAAETEEIVFTSGATESDNLALQGIARMYRRKGNHIITSAVEHKAVLDTCQYLETQGFRVTYLPVSPDGFVDLNELKKSITAETILISIMYGNNEIGTLEPIGEIGKIAKARGIFFHTDAVQSAGKVPLDVQAMGIDLASLSAHKMYGPKGIGALYVRKKNPRARIEPIFYGGGHERALRSGTLNVPAIVGFGKAAELCAEEMGSENARVLDLREKLRRKITNGLDEVYVNGNLERRLSGNLNMSFAYVDGESLMKGITERVAVSSGSTCSSAASAPSYVLRALGVNENLIHGSVRFGLGRFNTDSDVLTAAEHIIRVVQDLRSRSPLYEMKT